jgi:OmpA-OmpF porin, OOP family
VKAAILSIAFLGICFISYAQNLVPNPSFEMYSSCPGGHSERKEEFRVNGWTTVNAGTPDHFHTCSIGDADVPHNWAGISDPFEGEGYVGIYAWMNSGRDYREYIQCQLTSPMIRDTLYRVSFRYKLSSYSKYSIDRIGLLLSDSAVRFRRDRAPNLQPTFQALQDSALTERTGSWEIGSWEYRAHGSEHFVMIGNFFDDAVTHSYEIKFREVFGTFSLSLTATNYAQHLLMN